MTTYLFQLLLPLFLCAFPVMAGARSTGADDITGKWISVKKNLIIVIDREQSDFTARIVWFHNPKDPTPAEKCLDDHNPNPALRCRNIIGMQVLHGLVYDAKKHEWTSGKVYDATSGREWDAVVHLSPTGQMEVRGYWNFRWIGKTLLFDPIK